MTRTFAAFTVLLAMAGISDAQITVNLITNGDFEVGVPAVDSGGFQPEVSSWFIGANGFEDLYPGVDASGGSQAAGYDTTGTPPSQFIPSTWADWRSTGFAVTPGQELTWKFSYILDPVTAVNPEFPEEAGEIRAEFRAFTGIDGSGNLSGFSNRGTEIILLNAAGAINQSDGRTDIATPRGDNSGWIDVELTVTVPEESDVAGVPIAGYDLRFNQIFTLITFPFEGVFFLDDVQVLTQVAAIEGDYNNDGLVDAGDYTVWRDNLNAFGNPGEVSGDGDDGTATGTPDGLVDGNDYTFWASRYGATGPLPSLSTTIPEPASALLLLVGAVLPWTRRSNRRV